MALWGVNSFENDDAQEWSAAYREVGLPVAKSTIEVALSDKDSGGLSLDLSCRAIAAVEAVAFALGRGSSAAADAFAGAPEADVIAANALIPECDKMLDAILSGSGLEVHWSETGGDYEKWNEALSALRARVHGESIVTADFGGGDEIQADLSEPMKSTPYHGDVQVAIEHLSSEIQDLRRDMDEKLRLLADMIGELRRD